MRLTKKAEVALIVYFRFLFLTLIAMNIFKLICKGKIWQRKIFLTQRNECMERVQIPILIVTAF